MIDEKKWSREELLESTTAYFEMLEHELNDIKYIKKRYYEKLAIKLGRTPSSIEMRMQNISSVLSNLGRTWIAGLKPMKNVGANVTSQIEQIIWDIDGGKSIPSASFVGKVKVLRKKVLSTKKPQGNKSPGKSTVSIVQYKRDPYIVAWVLENSQGICECCNKLAPFIRPDGTGYLEVHHVRTLSDNGRDSIDNTIAICPNCHRNLHYGLDKITLRQDLYDKISRLKKIVS